MDKNELNTIAQAFQLMTEALAKHNHEWTPKELLIYDKAIRVIFQHVLLNGLDGRNKSS